MASPQTAIDQLRQAALEHRRGLARTLRRVAILGPGTMGARIAAHFANAGVPSLLLGRVRPNEKDRNSAARKGIETALKQKPSGFYTDDLVRLIKPGNYDDNFAELAECDWIIETVAEDLQTKRDLWGRVATVAKPDAILSTSTSGIPLAKIAEGFSQQFRRNFLGTHFFNPPRFLHLLEVIPGPETDPEVMSFAIEYSDRRLGKGIVLCKDTAGFVSNRIGCFFCATVEKVTFDNDYTVEEADALTGTLIGLPSSASFRLLDLVGLDIWAEVSPGMYRNLPHDTAWRDRFLLPECEQKMLERKWLGEKTGQGFYKKVTVGEERQIHCIDWKTLEYHPVQKPKFASVEAANAIEDLGERLRMLVNSDDRAGKFLWNLYSDYFLYSAEKIPEITDRIQDIDRSVRWGYAHKLGPFELWDAIGFKDVATRLEKEGRTLPENVVRMLSAGATSFYRYAETNGKKQQVFSFGKKDYEDVDALPGSLVLADVKRTRGVVKKNAGASLIDIGDGALCCELHSKMNAIGEDMISMLYAGLEELKNFDAMVIATEGENFCVGANLVPILLAAQEGEWDELSAAVNRLQQLNMSLKYAPKPVVSAPFGRTLGGGCELTLHTIPQAAAEVYMGQVELGVGLIPAAGGCKELLLRLKEARRVFELIGMAKVSMSAGEAKALGLLDPAAPVSMNQDRLIADAKAYALSLAANYAPGSPRTDIKVQGDATYALLKLGLWTMQQGNYISEHDCLIGEKLANILAGGRLAGEHLVSEQYLLDLEREAFLSLCGTPKTQERIAYMLKTGKPLRN